MTLTNDTKVALARGNFSAFKALMRQDYIHAKHFDVIDSVLMSATKYVETQGKEGIGNFIIAMSPRHGKTLSVSELFPAWFLGRNPDKRVMLVSYGATLAERSSRRARDYVGSGTYKAIFPTVKLSETSASVSEWEIAGTGGGTLAMGIQGALTGSGAHILVIDDPVKGRSVIENPDTREKIIEEYRGTIRTRLQPFGAQIVMATRWHVNDLSGYLLQSHPEDWMYVRLPALAEEDDPLGRAPGEAMWPEMYDAEALHKIRRDIGEYEFMAQYQQTPVSKGNTLFDMRHLHIIESAEGIEFKRIVRFWDLAITTKTHSDFSAGVKLGLTKDNKVIVLDVKRVKMLATDIMNYIARVAKEDGTSVPIVLEGERMGIAGVDILLRRDDLLGYSIRKQTPTADKMTRALAISSRWNAGLVSVLRGQYTTAFLDELSIFPNNKGHDDQVDALSGAYNSMQRIYIPTAEDWIKG